MNIATRFASTPLAGRTVKIEGVGIYNVKTKSYYFSEDDWGAVETSDAVVNSEETTFEDMVVSDASSVSNTPYVHYVMENMKSATVSSDACKVLTVNIQFYRFWLFHQANLLLDL